VGKKRNKKTVKRSCFETKNSTCLILQIGLIAQLVVHCASLRSVHGFNLNPVQAWIFFFFFFQVLFFTVFLFFYLILTSIYFFKFLNYL